MSAQFYNSIMEDEKRMCHVKDETLKIAAKKVAETYSSSSLQRGTTFLEYNIPQNRCAYLFKYAPMHTDLVSKCFKLMMNHDTVKFILEQRKDLKICCLGGGPGTDIAGLFKALATLPSCHQKVSEVTVLDLCGGWRNSFKHIISRLKHGKVEGVPAKFIDSNNFKANLIAVNLLQTIPDSVLKVISSADIICMVKFVSAVLGKAESFNALKVIAEKLKPGCLVLCIDNFYAQLFLSLENISKETGLIAVLGPLHVNHKRQGSNSKKNLYGCSPLLSTRVTAIGSIKTSAPQSLPLCEARLIPMNSASDISLEVTSNNENDDSWDTDSESDDICTDLLLPNAIMDSNRRTKIAEQITTFSYDKFTQTQSKYFKKCEQEVNDLSVSEELSELPSLIAALSDLLVVMKKLKQKNIKSQCCCNRTNTL